MEQVQTLTVIKRNRSDLGWGEKVPQTFELDGITFTYSCPILCWGVVAFEYINEEANMMLFVNNW